MVKLLLELHLTYGHVKKPLQIHELVVLRRGANTQRYYQYFKELHGLAITFNGRVEASLRFMTLYQEAKLAILVIAATAAPSVLVIAACRAMNMGGSLEQ
jgi:hypothetical protein